MNQQNVEIVLCHPNAKIPERMSELAGGWDIYCTEIITPSVDQVIYKVGFKLKPPINYKVTLVPRSSITNTKWVLQNSPGLGDPDFTGEYQFRFRSFPEIKYDIKTPYLNYPEIPYKIGERIGQLYLEEIIPINFIIEDNFESTSRNPDGFGTTGKK